MSIRRRTVLAASAGLAIARAAQGEIGRAHV